MSTVEPRVLGYVGELIVASGISQERLPAFGSRQWTRASLAVRDASCAVMALAHLEGGLERPHEVARHVRDLRVAETAEACRLWQRAAVFLAEDWAAQRARQGERHAAWLRLQAAARGEYVPGYGPIGVALWEPSERLAA